MRFESRVKAADIGRWADRYTYAGEPELIAGPRRARPPSRPLTLHPR